MKILVVLLCCTLACAERPDHNANPVVKTPTGSFRGTILKSHFGKDIYSFLGIRYADAPTGRDRFKHAHPVEPHRHIVNATEDGPLCPQLHSVNREVSEDCLYLNVYTTNLPRKPHQHYRSVMVYLHPDADITSSGTSYDLGPQLLLDHDIVLVTPNYRLGALGFLSTGDSRAPGNAGLKDQVLALRWVQQNIKAFGGDPNSVTLAGYGTGSMSVTAHIVSPMSKDLFHRAFVMSGAITTQMPLPTNQRSLAKKQAKILGCPTKSLNKMFDCLYEKTPEEFAASYDELATFSEYPLLVWSPVVEQTQSNDDDCDDDEKPFLTGQPADIMRDGNANFVPLDIGANKDEYGFLVIPAEEEAQCGNTTLYDEWNCNWEELAPRRFGYESDTDRSREISKALRSFYLNDEPLEAGKYQGLAQLYADSLVNFQVHRFERLMATYSQYPVWCYHHFYQGCDTYARWSDGKRFGIVHYDEQILLFKIADRPNICKKDVKYANEIWELVVNFADTGNPMPDDIADKYPVRWLQSTKDKPQHFGYRGETKRMFPGVIYQKRMNIWDELFPLE